MKKIVQLIFAFVLAMAFAGLSSCVAQNPAQSSSGSSTAVQQTESSASSSAANTSASTSSPTAQVAGSSASASSAAASSSSSPPDTVSVVENGEYTSKDEVALYIHLYGHLPGNYISKTKARKAGWVSTKGNLWDVLPGKSIGGSEFYDDEDQLPDAKGRRWTECDIDYNGGRRNSKRIVFSNDGLIFYTSDHYKTFEQLY